MSEKGNKGSLKDQIKDRYITVYGFHLSFRIQEILEGL